MLYILSFKDSLLFVSYLDKLNLKVEFDDVKCVIKDGDFIIAQGAKENGLYKFSGIPEHGIISSSFDIVLYDYFGHLNYNSL